MMILLSFADVAIPHSRLSKFPSKNYIARTILTGRLHSRIHPLGFLFNGPSTPVNTKELAIATPIATQDIEGVTVSERASFGINIPTDNDRKTLTVGPILDKGNETPQRYRLALNNLPKHLAVFGLTGSGKTNTIHHLLIQLWENYRIPFLVIEPAKAEYRALAEHEELKDELIVIFAGVDQTAACPLRLNPFDFDPGKDNDANRIHLLTHIDRLKATFNATLMTCLSLQACRRSMYSFRSILMKFPPLSLFFVWNIILVCVFQACFWTIFQKIKKYFQKWREPWQREKRC